MSLYAPIYEACDTPAVRALIGDPLRMSSFGDAGPGPVAKPYVVWQTVTGEPINYLAQRPDIDRFQLQVDVYASSAVQARQVAAAILEAIELEAHVTSFNGESTDPQTKDRRFSFDVDWFVNR